MAYSSLFVLAAWCLGGGGESLLRVNCLSCSRGRCLRVLMWLAYCLLDVALYTCADYSLEFTAVFDCLQIVY